MGRRFSDKHGKDIEKLKTIRDHIMGGDPLNQKYRDHPLRGKWSDCRECHIQPDWLLIYKIDYRTPETLVLIRTGSHSDLFE